MWILLPANKPLVLDRVELFGFFSHYVNLKESELFQKKEGNFAVVVAVI